MPPTTETLVPTLQVRINGADLPAEAAASVLAVTVHQDVNLSSMFTLRLTDWDPARSAVRWMDDRLFAPGGEAEVRLGYVDRLETLMKGEIAALEPAFQAGRPPELTVRGFDRGFRLARGRKTRSFTEQKDSDIAGRLASDAGLTAQTDDTGVTLPYVLQHNQSDLEFLRTRAARIGYEVWVEDKTLHFRKRPFNAGEVLTLQRDGDLIEFNVRQNTAWQVSSVTVQGWNLADKAAVEGKAAAGAEGAAMGNGRAGPAAGKEAFGDATDILVRVPVASQAEADAVAAGQLRESALAYVTGEGIAAGNTALRAGTVIRIEGLGSRFSGPYYVTGAVHSYQPRRGYRTEFKVVRNAT